jgi:hypothetical protein
VSLTETQLAVLALVRRFVKRQQLVFDALMNIRPHLVMYADHRTELTEEESRELSRLRHEYFRQSPSGHWGVDKEWTYFLHGVGCRLVHNVTQEPIDWNASNVDGFDKFWLVDYLQWLLGQQSNDEWLQVLKTQFAERSASLPQRVDSKLREFIFPILEELSQDGILSEPDYNRYTLLDVSRSETDHS